MKRREVGIREVSRERRKRERRERKREERERERKREREREKERGIERERETLFNKAKYSRFDCVSKSSNLFRRNGGESPIL